MTDEAGLRCCSAVAAPPARQAHPGSDCTWRPRAGRRAREGRHRVGRQSVEGTIVAWRGDTLLVQPQSRTDTVRVASGALKKLRVVESPALWRYTSPSTINFYSSTAIPRAHDVTSRSGDAYERLLLVGTKTELA